MPRRDKKRSRARVTKKVVGGGREKDTGKDNTSYFTRSCIRALGARFGGVPLT